jgi:hypothetical protein
MTRSSAPLVLLKNRLGVSDSQRRSEIALDFLREPLKQPYRSAAQRGWAPTPPTQRGLQHAICRFLSCVRSLAERDPLDREA